MNNLIKKQLLKTQNAIIPIFDENTVQIFIPKQDANQTKQDSKLVIGNSYKVQIADYIINEPSNFNLSCNWNNNTKPDDYTLFIEVLEIMGKMIKVQSIGATTKTSWCGWLPSKSILNFERV